MASRIERVIGNLKAALVEWNELISPAIIPSSQDRAVNEIIEAILTFDPQYREQAIKMALLFKGVDVSDAVKKYSAKTMTRIPFALVVPTTSSNGHNYPVNTPTALISDTSARSLRADGSLGNDAPNTLSIYRAATAAEAGAFWDTFFQALETKFLTPERRTELEAAAPVAAK